MESCIFEFMNSTNQPIEGNSRLLSTMDTGRIKDSRFHGQVMYFSIEGAAKECDLRIIDFFELIFFKTGTGIHSVNNINTQHKIGEKQVHISFPGHVHFWNIKNYSGHRLLLSREFVQKQFPQIDFLTSIQQQFLVLTLESDIFDQLWADLDLLISEISKPEIDLSIFSLRMEIILNCIEMNLRKPVKGNAGVYKKIDPVLERLQQMLEENFDQEKEVDFYARKLFLTPNYLNRLCRRQWGINVKKVIDNRIVMEAIRLLMDDKMYTIMDISLRLGFSNASNFSRFLKSRTNNSALQLRNQLRSIVE